MHDMHQTELARAMGSVARELLGEPNAALSSREELRFGSRGSLSVDRIKGMYFDHELGEGGGVIKFLQSRLRLEKEDAVAYLQERGHIQKATAPNDSDKSKIVATYDYVAADGKLLFQVVRWEPKFFSQRPPDGKGGWRKGKGAMKGVERVIYRLPAVLAAVASNRTIYICEGEKGVHALESIGLVGTCSPGGAGKWKNPAYDRPLDGADVVILPDNDPQKVNDKTGEPMWHPDGRPVLPGQDHAVDVARRLVGAGPVRVLMLPGLPLKGDVADWVAAGGTAAELERLAGEQPYCADKERPADQNPDIGELPPGIDDPGYAAAVEADAGDQRDTPAGVLAEFNAKYFVVNEDGKTLVYKPTFDQRINRRYFQRITFEDLKKLYLNRSVTFGRNGGKKITEPAANFWLHHPDRRQFTGGITFDPSGRNIPADTLNMWRGFAVEPRAGSWKRLQDHILKILCVGNSEHFNYVMGWMARMVQRPAEQGEVAIVMRGIEGCGKGTLANAIKHILGQHGMAISNAKHLVGNFNAHLRDAVFLFADEAFFAGDRAHEGVLKALITDPFLTIEAKYQNAVQTPNFVHLMMASNQDWVIPVSMFPRRFLMLDALPNRANDHAYFAAISGEMRNGGYEAMLHDLLNYDLTFFNHRDPPKTDGLQTQKKLSLPSAEAWWLGVLHRGYVHESKLGLEDYFSRWHEQVATELLFKSYEAFARARGDRHPLHRETFGRFMVSMGAKAGRWRDVVTGEHICDVQNHYGGTSRKSEKVTPPRACGYSLGDLTTARAAFVRTVGAVDWPADEEPET
jgi:hypothetical protein